MTDCCRSMHPSILREGNGEADRGLARSKQNFSALLQFVRSSLSTIALGICVVLSSPCAVAKAQQPSGPPSTETFETAFAEARQGCAGLWADHAFDPIRTKVPLTEEKPTFSMLTNNERLRPKDRPLADLAIKTLEKCRALYAPSFSMLPEAIQIALRGIEQKQDALVAELYNGKISFGTYNVGMNRLTGQFTNSISAFKLKFPPPESSQSTKNIRSPPSPPEKSDAS